LGSLGARIGKARFDELQSYQRAMALFRAEHRLAERLPGCEKVNLASQLRRVALGTVSNIAEGYGRYHSADKLRFFYYARGSLFEALSGLISAHAVGTIDDKQLAWARQAMPKPVSP